MYLRHLLGSPSSSSKPNPKQNHRSFNALKTLVDCLEVAEVAARHPSSGETGGIKLQEVEGRLSSTLPAELLLVLKPGIASSDSYTDPEMQELQAVWPCHKEASGSQ